MKTFALTLLVLLPLTGRCVQAVAQQGPLKGVVWQEPTAVEQAEADLLRMYEMGIEAIRTGLIQNLSLLTMADTLGLELFQDLPFERLTVADLRDSVDVARLLLEGALYRARPHPSARHFGLVRNGDTSDPAACTFLKELADYARSQGPPETRVYYVTTFVHDEACGRTVDVILLDVGDREEPVTAAARWRANREQPVGLAAVGTWVNAEAGEGYRIPHSLEAQARYLEEALTPALDPAGEPLYAVFVNRWRDVQAPTPSLVHDLERPYERPYGLLTESGAERPARRVVEGMYTGGQTVFAFPAGAPEASWWWSWLTALGWLVVATLGIIYNWSVYFRQDLRRYFFAHGFYLQILGQGRDIQPVIAVLILVLLSLSAGLVGTVLLHLVRPEPFFLLGVSRLPLQVQDVLVSLFQRPWLLLLLLASLYALILTGWVILLTAIAGIRRRMTLGQRLMLVGWTRWPLMLLMGAALVVVRLPESQHPMVALALAGGWIFASVWAVLRTLFDFSSAMRVPLGRTLLLGAGGPFLVLGLVVLVLTQSRAMPLLRYAWHLATRG